MRAIIMPSLCHFYVHLPGYQCGHSVSLRTTVRLAAAILRKVVDCLAPSMTTMLVRGKEVREGGRKGGREGGEREEGKKEG